VSAAGSDQAGTLRAALKAIRQQQARIAELEAERDAAHEPIAIVGMGCRFPGDAHGPAAFWEKLRTGFDAVGEVPADRWPAAAYFNADPENPGTMYSQRGAFLRDVDKFDARFFGISPREAASMDPQQRLLLETAWEAFEDAGVVPEQLRGSATGVYVGLTVIDYLKLLYRDDLTRLDAYAATGNVANIAAGRLSYFFGLNGPAMTLDTACSSSLVAVHLACQSLRHGESQLALAAGVNLILAPDNSVAVSRARMLAPDGHCKTFDARADGYARGEGCGVVVLKRLSQAQADGDRVWAVIRGTAVAQDGARSGLTVPHGPSQQAVIKSALAAAGVTPAEVGYVEAHGTGTALGDPIEAEALAGVFGRDRARGTPLVLGSLKTNVGHMESAAGIGGVIKLALMLQHGEIPAHCHFETENPEVRLGDIPAKIPTALQSWPDGYAGRVAGVSSFGSSGTIAHVVMAAPPVEAATGRAPGPPAQPLRLWLSAKSPASLRRLADRFADYLEKLPPGVAAVDVCWTAATARTRFAHRRCVTGNSAGELARALREDEADPAPVPEPDVALWFGDGAGRRVSLPTYPFEPVRHWVEPERRAGPAAAATPAALDVGIMFFNGTERPGADSYRLLFAAAEFTDARGFSSVWLPERHFTAFGGVYPNPATLHAALARQTKRLRLMAGSSVLPLHDARRLAEEWSVVDNLSGGRAGMSFASGWNPADFSLRPENYEGRRDALFAGIEELRRLWRGEARPTTDGAGAPVDLRIYPTPVQSELPLWVTAAGNPATFERAGTAGAHLLTHLLDQDVAELTEKIARYRSARERAGHDPAAGRVTVMLHTFVGPEAAAVHAKVRGPFTAYLRENLHLLGGLAASRGQSVDVTALSDAEQTAFVEFLYDRFANTRALLGTPEQCLPLVRQLAEAGVAEIACLLDFGPVDDDVIAMLPDLAAFRESIARLLPAGEARPLPEAKRGRAVGVADPLAGLHEVAWRPVDRPTAPASTVGEPWVVLVDRGGCGERLAAALRDEGVAVEVSAFDQPAGAVTAASVVVNCRPLDGDIEAEDTLKVLQTTRGRLWTITQGAQGLGGVAPVARAAAHWGLLRVLPVEQPPRWGGLIDLDPGKAAADQVSVLARWLVTELEEDQLAIRNDEVNAARLVERPPAGLAAARAFAVKKDAAYLVTGGLGGVGWAVTRWLVDQGARTMHLLCRHEPNPQQQQQLETWRLGGNNVTPWSVDLADRAALEQILTSLRVAGQPVLRGVFHAAGAWCDCLLADLTPAEYARTWSAKVEGARHLDALLEDAPLDAFVLFSAFSALLPAPGQGNYAAANAALDALAHQRRARGGHALSINWGPWSEVGFATTDHGRRAHERLESLGISRFNPREGIATLEAALHREAAQLAVMRVDWGRLFTADPQARLSPLLRELRDAHAAPAAAAPAEAGRIVQTVAMLPAAEQLDGLAQALGEIVAAVLRMRVEEVVSEVPLTDQGVDSLVAIEIKNRIQTEATVDVPLTRLLEGPTLQALAEELLPRIKLAALATGELTGEVEEVEI